LPVIYVRVNLAICSRPRVLKEWV